MKRAVNSIFIISISAVYLLGASLAQGEPESSDSLIAKAEVYIKDGSYEQAESSLDQAFQAAKDEEDHESLMKIGDLYLSIDKSLGEKAMNAWTEAGKMKCR